MADENVFERFTSDGRSKGKKKNETYFKYF